MCKPNNYHWCCYACVLSIHIVIRVGQVLEKKRYNNYYTTITLYKNINNPHIVYVSLGNILLC